MIRSVAYFGISFREWALLLALSLLWGSAFFFGQVALVELPPFTIVFCRVALATLVLVSIAMATGQAAYLSWRHWLIFLRLGVLNCLLPFTLLLWSQSRMGSGLVAVLVAGTPLFTALVAHFLSADEKLTRSRLAGVLLGFVGVAVAMGPLTLQSRTDLVACVATIAAGFCYSIAAVLGRRSREMPALPLAAGQLITCSLLSLPIAIAVERPWTLDMPSVASWTSILVLALFSTALGYVLFFRLLLSIGAVNVSLVSLLAPFTALLLAAVALHEPLDWPAFAGAGLIITGLATLDGRVTRSIVRTFI
jgi:drug/metabolite transporter (DMT)-like permease